MSDPELDYIKIPDELTDHIRSLADSRCKAKHPDYYQELTCVGPGSSHFGPPCDGCLNEERERWKAKRATVQGRLLSPEEADELKKRLGIE